MGQKSDAEMAVAAGLQGRCKATLQTSPTSPPRTSAPHAPAAA
jgi:hypothetical protein